MGDFSIQALVWNLLAAFGAFRVVSVVAVPDIREGLETLFDFAEWFRDRMDRLCRRRRR